MAAGARRHPEGNDHYTYLFRLVLPLAIGLLAAAPDAAAEGETATSWLIPSTDPPPGWSRPSRTGKPWPWRTAASSGW